MAGVGPDLLAGSGPGSQTLCVAERAWILWNMKESWEESHCLHTVYRSLTVCLLPEKSGHVSQLSELRWRPPSVRQTGVCAGASLLKAVLTRLVCTASSQTNSIPRGGQGR